MKLTDYEFIKILQSEERMEQYIQKLCGELKKIDSRIWQIHFMVPKKKRMKVLSSFFEELVAKKKITKSYLPKRMILSLVYESCYVPYIIDPVSDAVKPSTIKHGWITKYQKFYNRYPKPTSTPNFGTIYNFNESTPNPIIPYSEWKRKKDSPIDSPIIPYNGFEKRDERSSNKQWSTFLFSSTPVVAPAPQIFESPLPAPLKIQRKSVSRRKFNNTKKHRPAKKGQRRNKVSLSAADETMSSNQLHTSCNFADTPALNVNCEIVTHHSDLTCASKVTEEEYSHEDTALEVHIEVEHHQSPLTYIRDVDLDISSRLSELNMIVSGRQILKRHFSREDVGNLKEKQGVNDDWVANIKSVEDKLRYLDDYGDHIQEEHAKTSNVVRNLSAETSGTEYQSLIYAPQGSEMSPAVIKDTQDTVEALHSSTVMDAEGTSLFRQIPDSASYPVTNVILKTLKTSSFNEDTPKNSLPLNSISELKGSVMNHVCPRTVKTPLINQNSAKISLSSNPASDCTSYVISQKVLQEKQLVEVNNENGDSDFRTPAFRKTIQQNTNNFKEMTRKTRSMTNDGENKKLTDFSGYEIMKKLFAGSKTKSAVKKSGGKVNKIKEHGEKMMKKRSTSRVQTRIINVSYLSKNSNDAPTAGKLFSEDSCGRSYRKLFTDTEDDEVNELRKVKPKSKKIICSTSESEATDMEGKARNFSAVDEFINVSDRVKRLSIVNDGDNFSNVADTSGTTKSFPQTPKNSFTGRAQTSWRHFVLGSPQSAKKGASQASASSSKIMRDNLHRKMNLHENMTSLSCLVQDSPLSFSESDIKAINSNSLSSTSLVETSSHTSRRSRLLVKKSGSQLSSAKSCKTINANSQREKIASISQGSHNTRQRSPALFTGSIENSSPKVIVTSSYQKGKTSQEVTTPMISSQMPTLSRNCHNTIIANVITHSINSSSPVSDKMGYVNKTLRQLYSPKLLNQYQKENYLSPSSTSPGFKITMNSFERSLGQVSQKIVSSSYSPATSEKDSDVSLTFTGKRSKVRRPFKERKQNRRTIPIADLSSDESDFDVYMTRWQSRETDNKNKPSSLSSPKKFEKISPTTVTIMKGAAKVIEEGDRMCRELFNNSADKQSPNASGIFKRFGYFSEDEYESDELSAILKDDMIRIKIRENTHGTSLNSVKNEEELRSEEFVDYTQEVRKLMRTIGAENNDEGGSTVALAINHSPQVSLTQTFQTLSMAAYHQRLWDSLPDTMDTALTTAEEKLKQAQNTLRNLYSEKGINSQTSQFMEETPDDFDQSF